MKTTPRDDHKPLHLLDTGRLRNSLFRVAPFRTPLPSAPPLRIFNPDGKRIFSKPAPRFPGNDRGPQGAA